VLSLELFGNLFSKKFLPDDVGVSELFYDHSYMIYLVEETAHTQFYGQMI
jgi:hypothetical protein